MTSELNQLFEDHKKVAIDLADRFNQRDIDGIRKLFLDDLKWVDSDGRVETDGLTAYIDFLTKVFAAHPNLQVKIGEFIGIGDLLVQTEHLWGFSDGGTQDVLYVIEFTGMQIRKYTSFPAVQA